MYQTAHQNDGFIALRLCCSKLNPACMCYDSKPAKHHKARWAIQLLNHLLGLVHVTFKSDQVPWFRLEVLSIQSRKSFKHFFCFHRTLGISAKDLEGFKADIALIYTALACLPQILIFVTRNFIGSCIIRCAFWLVSLKDDCLERVLRKAFWIKKSINKISLHLSNSFEKYFIKAIENFFPVFA